MHWRGHARGDDGQAVLVLVVVAGVLVVAVAWLTVVGRAASLRADATSAADAAALAAVESLRSQVVSGGIAFGDRFDVAAACAAAAAYADRNGAELLACEPLGGLASGHPFTPAVGVSQVRVEVRTDDALSGGTAGRLGVAGERAEASARAELELQWRGGGPCTVPSSLEERLLQAVEDLEPEGDVTYRQIGCGVAPSGARPFDAVRFDDVEDGDAARASADFCRPRPLLDPELFAHRDAVACGSLLDALRDSVDLRVRLLPDT